MLSRYNPAIDHPIHLLRGGAIGIDSGNIEREIRIRWAYVFDQQPSDEMIRKLECIIDAIKRDVPISGNSFVDRLSNDKRRQIGLLVHGIFGQIPMRDRGNIEIAFNPYFTSEEWRRLSEWVNGKK